MCSRGYLKNKKETGVLKAWILPRDEQEKKNAMGSHLEQNHGTYCYQKINFRVFRMWKFCMTHSWEGGQGCLFPDLQLDYVSKMFNISFLDLVIPMSTWLSSSQHISMCIFMQWKRLQKPAKALCFPPSFKSEDVFHTSYFSKAGRLCNTFILPKW